MHLPMFADFLWRRIATDYLFSWKFNQSRLLIEIPIRNLEEFWHLLYNSNSSNKTYKPNNLTHISVCILYLWKLEGAIKLLRKYFVCINRAKKMYKPTNLGKIDMIIYFLKSYIYKQCWVETPDFLYCLTLMKMNALNSSDFAASKFELTLC